MDEEFREDDLEQDDSDGLEFLTDWEREELEEERGDLAILAMGRKFREDDAKDQVIDPEQVQKVLSVYKKMKKVFEGKNVKVTYMLFEPNKKDGCVKLEGKEIAFDDASLFSEVVRGCEAAEGYRKTNGNMVIAFGYSGLTRLINEG